MLCDIFQEPRAPIVAHIYVPFTFHLHKSMFDLRFITCIYVDLRSICVHLRSIYVPFEFFVHLRTSFDLRSMSLHVRFMFHLRTSTTIYVTFTYLFHFQASSGPGTWYEYQEPLTSCLNQAPSLQTKTHYGSNRVAIGATDASNNAIFIKTSSRTQWDRSHDEFAK